MNYDNKIDRAVSSLYKKISILELDDFKISDYNKRYFKDYIKNFYFFMPLYSQLLKKALNKLNKPIEESVFVDYGGGCGILTFLAIELGFKEVIYNDIYDVSIEDVTIISQEMNSPIQHIVAGGIKEFVIYLNEKNVSIDLFCSFDVLEHIYNLKEWFSEFKNINGPFSLCFMTSANGSNPFKNRVLKKIHYKAEYIGSIKKEGWKERDSNTSFLTIRQEIIKQHFPELDLNEVKRLAKETRGLYINDILQKIKDYKETGFLDYKITHKTNTCDPMTGNWAENIIDLKEMREMIQDNKHKVKYTNSIYSFSQSKLLNAPKYILNLCSYILGEENLFFSPTYTLEIDIKE